MDIITIANISGFIAVAIVLGTFRHHPLRAVADTAKAQLLLPNILVLILSNSLGSSNNAVTW